MVESREQFIRQLEEGSDHIADRPRHELAVLLRRAALRLRNVEGLMLESEVNGALLLIAAEMRKPKSDLIEHILREWLEKHSYLPVHMLDDDSETDGAAA